MSSLTDQERVGLEEVFLSISSHRGGYNKFSFYHSIKQGVMQQHSKIGKYYRSESLFKKLKKGIKLLQFAHITHKNSKKKKNLS